MKDRVPLYPGRVKLEPVAGQANTYDMTRADQPQQEGTKLNKANLLTDETAAKIWPDSTTRPSNPSVNDALSALVQPEVSAVGTYTGTGVEFGSLIEKTTGTTIYNQRDVVVGNGVLVKMDVSGNIYSSADSGSTWVSRGRAGTTGTWNSMCYGNGIYVARSYNTAAWSEDLDTWHTVQLHDLTYGTPWIAFGDGRFVTCDSYGFFYSDDGKTFTRTLQLPDHEVRNRIVYGNGVFVICGTYNQSSSYAMYSSDGIVWSNAALPNTRYTTSAICFARGEFVAACSNMGLGNYDCTVWIYTSKTGADWVQSAELIALRNTSNSNDLRWMCYSEDTDTLFLGTFTGVSSNAVTRIYMSGANSTEWTYLVPSDSYNVVAYNAVAFNSKLVLAGESSNSNNQTHSTDVSFDLNPTVEIFTDTQMRFLYIEEIGSNNSNRNGTFYLLATQHGHIGVSIRICFLENRVLVCNAESNWINRASAKYAYYCVR